MVLCHGPGGAQIQRSDQERRFEMFCQGVQGGLLGSKNFNSMALMPSSIKRYCHASTMCVITVIANLATYHWSWHTNAFVA